MKTIRTLVPTLLISSCLGVANAQTGNVGIGTSSPDASAALDITSSNKGLLVPRLRESARTGMTAPAPGLLVYQTDGTQPGFWYYAGSARNAGWTFLNPNGDNLGSHTATQNLNLTNNLLVGGTAATPSTSGLSINGSGNVGIGVTNPTARFQVQGNTRIDQAGSVPAVDVTILGSGSGVHALSTGGDGVWGISQNSSSAGVHGENTTGGDGVYGNSSGSYGSGVHGITDDGNGIVGEASGTGSAGYFRNTNLGSTSPALTVLNYGTAPGVSSTSFSGAGVYGKTLIVNGIGVSGESPAHSGDGVRGTSAGVGIGVHGITDNGSGVLGEASGVEGSGGIFVNSNTNNPYAALQASTIGTGWAVDVFNVANAAGGGIRVQTQYTKGGTALSVARGTIALSSTPAYTSGSIIDDPILIVKTTGFVTIPTGAPLTNGVTVWVVNNSGGSLSVSNTTVGLFPISNGRAQQFLYVYSVNAGNWVPVQ